VVLDLVSYQLIGWSMQQRIDRELAVNAILMAVWRSQPQQEVIVHSDQESQFSNYGWQDFLKAHNARSDISR
jgi:putative transposase